MLQVNIPVPAGAREGLLFDLALGGLPDVTGWYTPKRGFLVRNPDTEVLQAVKNRKRQPDGSTGLNNLVPFAPLTPPAVLENRINGRPSLSFTSGAQRMLYDGLLPAGDFACAILFRTPTPASTKIIAASSNLAGRRAIYLTFSSGVTSLVSSFGSAGSAATAIAPITPETWVAAFISHDNVAHEASLSVNGAAWVSTINAAASATDQTFALGGYYDSTPAGFEGEVAEMVIFKRPLKGATNALYYNRSKRYLRARYRQAIADS